LRTVKLAVRRLMPGDEAVAASLFALLAEVLEEPGKALEPPYVATLLARSESWIVAAFDGAEVVGGLTAHALPMTRSRRIEFFIYDLAVAAPFRRRGIGRALLQFLVERGLVGDAFDIFVLAEADDDEAIAFYRAVGGVPASAVMFTFARGRADATALRSAVLHRAHR
jgi:aminoglycoside 3-N-acetyltransferase I